MQTIKVGPSETMYDIALRYYGSAVYAADIGQANAINATQDISGMTLILPDIEITPQEFSLKNRLPKTISTKYPL